MSDSRISIQQSLNNHGPWRLFKNTFALAIGRNLNALGRLLIMSMVVRGLGAETFGAYSVIVALLTIADWLLDFGTTDVFVREVVKEPARYGKVRRALVALKLLQAPIAIFFMIIVLTSTHYPAQVVQAGIVVALSLSFFSGVAIYRSIFKATLTMEREMLAELISVLVMIPLVMAAIFFDLGLMGLAISLVVSRLVFLGGCIVLAGGERSLRFTGVRKSEVVWLARSSVIIGTIGFLTVINNAIEIVMLSLLSPMADVAYFSAAQKLIWPVFMVLGAVGTSFYPVLAQQYPRDRGSYFKSCQRALDVTLILGGLAVSGVYCGADFLLAIIGPEMRPAALALQLLVIMCVIKSVSAVIGPTLFIVNAQRFALAYFAFGLVAKMLLIGLIAPEYGFAGVAWVTLGTELLLFTPATLFFVWRFTGYRPKIAVTLKAAAATAAAIFAATALLPSGTFLCAILAGIIFCAAAVLLRLVQPRELKSILAGRRESRD